jgi:hypothetical protein
MNLTVRVAVYAQKGTDRHHQAGLFQKFSFGTLAPRLARLQSPAGKTPASVVDTLDEEKPPSLITGRDTSRGSKTHVSIFPLSCMSGIVYCDILRSVHPE